MPFEVLCLQMLDHTAAKWSIFVQLTSLRCVQRMLYLSWLVRAERVSPSGQAVCMALAVPVREPTAQESTRCHRWQSCRPKCQRRWAKSHGAAVQAQTWRWTRQAVVAHVSSRSLHASHRLRFGCCRHVFAPQVFELLSELALGFSSLVVKQPSRYAKRSDPVFEGVVPHDLRVPAGNHGNNT